MTPTHLLYLHGFRSSPRSFKAQRLQAWLAAHRSAVRWHCPQLPPSPRAAMALVQAGSRDWPAASSAVVGSSLGGYYATWVAQATGWPAVLLNPAVDPARDLAPYVGELTAFHAPEERLVFHTRYLAELRQLQVPAIAHPERLLAVIAKGDEVLDWREMVARYPHAQLRLLEGGDHGLSDFADHLPTVLGFLDLA